MHGDRGKVHRVRGGARKGGGGGYTVGVFEGGCGEIMVCGVCACGIRHKTNTICWS